MRLRTQAPLLTYLLTWRPPRRFCRCRCAPLFCAVFRRVWCRRPLSCAVVFSVLLCALGAHLDQVPLNYPSETVVQPSSTAHFHYGFPAGEPLSWYSKNC